MTATGSNRKRAQWVGREKIQVGSRQFQTTLACCRQKNFIKQSKYDKHTKGQSSINSM